MRIQVIALSLLMSVSANAAEKLKVVDDFYSESTTLLKSAEKEKDTAHKSEKLKDLEKSFKSTLDRYEKENPKKGNKAEEQVAVLYYTLEPVFKIFDGKKPADRESCERVRQEVKTGDSMGKPEESPSSRQALEAYKWLDLLCPAPVIEEEKD